MGRRKKTSGGQALILVTLALIAMTGMLGLAVDLGWSFFVQKQAQAAADGAALSAVQEAVQRVRAGGGTVSGITCPSATVDCESTAISCSAVGSTSNLNNGCQYALKNGFDWTTSRQSVTFQSGAAPTLPTTPSGTSLGVVNISYWATARTVQTIPQLFSAILGNTQGTVAAIATAAIAGSIGPGSFYGMNRVGDCDDGECGVDVDTGHGGGGGAGGSVTCGSGTSDLCAPAGIIMASSCASKATPGCSEDYAANDPSHIGAMSGSLTVMSSGGVNGNWNDMSGNPLAPNYTTNPKEFQDPSAGNPQPPLQTPASSMGTCAIPHASASTATTLSGTLGPYVYYTYNTIGASSKPIPDGGQITLSAATSFSSSSAAPCSTVSANAPLANGSTGTIISTTGTTDSSFPTYVFVGGLKVAAPMTLGPGQYVMAGTNSVTGSVFSVTGSGGVDGTSAAAQSTGTMFIFTDAAYPGMNLAANTAATFTPLVTGAGALSQGTLDFSGTLGGSSVEMYGVVNSNVSGSLAPSAQNAFSGYVWWQDRRNSNVGYNEPAGSPGCDSHCTGDDGSVISCAYGCVDGSPSTPNVLATSNHVTATSVGVQFGNGNTKIALHGVYYQPRGAYIDIGNGNTGFSCGSAAPGCPLQVVTGSFLMSSGATRLVLAGPTNPLLTYKATLIQ